MVTRGLGALGVELGGNLQVESAPDNVKGHWEDRDVFEFNKRLLAALALEWDVVDPGDSALMGASSLAPMVEEAQALIGSKAAGHWAWAFKDPRTARLWPFWRRVLVGNAQFELNFVWVLRRPAAVAQSLMRRDGFDSLKSHLLWLNHNLIPFDDIARHPHVVVDYDRMLEQPKGQLRRIADALMLELADAKAIDDFASAFLDRSLSHFEELGASHSVVGAELLAERSYGALLGVASGKVGIGDDRFLLRWEALRQEAALFSEVALRVTASTLSERGLDDVHSRLLTQLGREQQGAASDLQKQVEETLREQHAETGRRITQVESRLGDAQRAEQAAMGAGLQKQVEETLREQQAETGRRITQVESRLGDAQRAEQAAMGAGLQKQVEETLREQQAETGRRIEQAESGLQKQLGETLREQQAETGRRIEQAESGLQKQLGETLREQYAETGRRIEQAESGLQKQLGETLREQQAETGRRIEQAESSLQRQLGELRTQLAELRADTERANRDLALANQLLNKERYSIFKPLLRWAYRLGVAFIARLPEPVERQLRRAKRKLFRRSIPLTVDLSRPTAVAGRELGAGLELLAGSVAASDGYDVLVCPVIDWHFRFQRPQHLALQLAKRGRRVFYLSSTFDVADAPGFKILESPAPNVFLVKLCFAGEQPQIYQDLLRGRELQMLTASVGRLIDDAGLANLVAVVDLPFWRPLAEAIPGCFMVYDCMDYHGGFSTNSPQMVEEEARLIEVADLVVTTSATLSEIVGRSSPNVLIRNAGEVDYFKTAPDRRAYLSERPVAGYLGAIADWFDIELIASAARQYPEWDFVLVGAKTLSGTSQAERLENIKWIGEVPYAEAAAWVHSFDVALIPFKLTELTLCTNPVKVYEYLAAGKPVVATALPEVLAMGGAAHVADDHDHFIELLDVAMAERGDPARAAERSQWAAAHDWGTRGGQLDAAIRSAFPKVSVVMLTYNNLEFTQACLRSLEAHSCYPDWELVVVDNASSDGTPDHLRAYAAANPRVKLILNDENLGFAAGNNCGLRAATGDYLIVLNNDTYVTRGWMLDLIRHFRRSPDLGLLGPVTNNIGNEAKIEIDYADMAEMASAAYAYTSARPGEELAVAATAFFCVAMPRAVYEQVGDLDERFGLGFFEDDDYCQRVVQAGYRIAVAEDVFVHHHLSASFDQLEPARREALFEVNKALYEEKWGAWTPHRYRGD